jgi:hypothetical protein
MEQIDCHLRLEEVAPDQMDRYYIILNRTGYVSGDEYNRDYLLIGGGACIMTDGIDSSEIANEFLEDHCGETNDSYFIDPLVIYGEICDPAALAEELFDDYFLFVPDLRDNILQGYRLYTESGTENIVDLIESVMKEEKDMEIEDIILFRGEELELTTQLSTTFDQKAIDQLLDSEKADG